MATDPKAIKMVILDVDGTMTDGGVYITDDGRQFKKFNARDGMGIKLLKKAGIEVGIISHSKSTGMVTTRAAMLDIEYCYVGDEDKIKVLQQWSEKLKISMENIAYVGDDVNDIEVMKKVGLSACPGDAVNAVKEIATIILSKNGGDACIREFVDDYLLAGQD